jgi:hypothetical protein
MPKPGFSTQSADNCQSGSADARRYWQQEIVVLRLDGTLPTTTAVTGASYGFTRKCSID